MDEGSDYGGMVLLPDHMGGEAGRTYPASFYAPVVALPDPADYYHHLFPQDDVAP